MKYFKYTYIFYVVSSYALALYSYVYSRIKDFIEINSIMILIYTYPLNVISHIFQSNSDFIDLSIGASIMLLPMFVLWVLDRK